MYQVQQEFHPALMELFDEGGHVGIRTVTRVDLCEQLG